MSVGLLKNTNYYIKKEKRLDICAKVLYNQINSKIRLYTLGNYILLKHTGSET